jgi:Cu(I)/Ag(I) efflux system membrane fusion protein
VRVEIVNEQRRLRPGDYAEAAVTLPIGPQGDVYDRDLAGKWISPMHPQVIRNEPGQCPICGMDLVPTSKYGFADAPLPPPTSLHVPRSAVLLAGGNSIVYVETEPGRFEMRPVTIGPILRDKIVILEGVKAGESVATAGNFLIDSQMQLAGKPSLIDPTRASAKSEEPAGPLKLGPIAVAPIAGEAGATLERLFAAYFEIQRTLASDKKPTADVVHTLHDTAKELADDRSVPAESKRLVQEVAAKSEHLHHLDLTAVRKEFKPISQAMLKLAAQSRGEKAQTPFTQFYCPMVPGGGGDWLQPNGELVNPYFGSEMLRCGEKVREIPATKPDHKHDSHPGHDAAGATKAGA